MIPLADAFAFFRMALVTGLADREAAVAWADRRLLKQSHFALTELSLAGDLSLARMVGLLSELQGPPRYVLPLDLLFARAGALLEADPGRAAAIIRDLKLLIEEEPLPREIKGRLLALDGKDPNGGTALSEFLAPFAQYRDQLKELIDG